MTTYTSASTPETTWYQKRNAQAPTAAEPAIAIISPVLNSSFTTQWFWLRMAITKYKTTRNLPTLIGHKVYHNNRIGGF